MKWIAFQPLIGGMMLGAENAFGCPPVAVVDYQGVVNSELYLKYKQQHGVTLPHLLLNDGPLSLTETFIFDPGMLFEDVDVVCGVPFCSGLSSANTNTSGNDKSMGSDAVQNNNMLGMLKVSLTQIKPKAFIFENAYKLATPLGAKMRDRLFAVCKQNGYSATLVKVNTNCHGSPQNRPRTFFYAFKSASAPVLTFTPEPVPTIMECLSGLTDQHGWFCDDITTSTWYKFIMSHYNGASNWRELLLEDNATSTDNLFRTEEDWNLARTLFISEKQKKFIEHAYSKWKKGMNWMSTSWVWIGDMKLSAIYGKSLERLLHPLEDRTYSLREFMRFMGLPDDFQVPKVANMICQNVPVMTAQYYCKQIFKYLQNELKSSGSQFIVQDFSTPEWKKNSKIDVVTI